MKCDSYQPTLPSERNSDPNAAASEHIHQRVDGEPLDEGRLCSLIFGGDTPRGRCLLADSAHRVTAERGMTLAEMITKYAPPRFNNTAAYIAAVSRASGVAPNTRLNTLTETSTWAIIRAMQTHEGWREGTLTVTPP